MIEQHELKIGGDIGCSGKVGSSCFTFGSRVTFATNPVMNEEMTGLQLR